MTDSIATLTIKDYLLKVARQLAAVSSTPRLDAEMLLSHVLGKDRVYLIAHSELLLSHQAWDEANVLVARRKEGQPVAYLTGKQEFYGREFAINPAVLIPRPETELLVEQALSFLRRQTDGIRVLDLGTGSGCIVVTLASELAELNHAFLAVDISESAVGVAKVNAESHDVSGKVTFLKSNWFSSLGADRFSLIVANPPYIAFGDRRCSRETDYEPRGALFSTGNGLSDIIAILSGLPEYLLPGGLFLCEFGADQADDVMAQAVKILGESFGSFAVLRDLAGLPRLLHISRYPTTN